MMGYMTVVQFLSRLCGGEAFDMYYTLDEAFLSRLCGGEV